MQRRRFSSRRPRSGGAARLTRADESAPPRRPRWRNGAACQPQQLAARLLILAIGYLTHMRSALATRGHVALGWVVFACALLVFVRAASRRNVSEVDPSAEGAPRAIARTSAQRGRVACRYGMAAAALLAVPALVHISLLATAAHAAPAVLDLPPGSTPWRGFADPLWQPTFVGTHVVPDGARHGRPRLVQRSARGYCGEEPCEGRRPPATRRGREDHPLEIAIARPSREPRHAGHDSIVLRSPSDTRPSPATARSVECSVCILPRVGGASLPCYC
jgi:hypothetical protein